MVTGLITVITVRYINVRSLKYNNILYANYTLSKKVVILMALAPVYLLNSTTLVSSGQEAKQVLS